MTQLTTEAVSTDRLPARARELKADGCRLAGMTTVPSGDGMDILYHFDKDLALTHLRLRASAGDRVPSLCAVYAAAFMAENEVRDQFGLRFDGLAPDYEGTFFLEEGVEATPLCPGAVAEIEKKESNPS